MTRRWCQGLVVCAALWSPPVALLGLTLLMGAQVVMVPTAFAATPEFVADIEDRLIWDRAAAAVKAKQWSQADQMLRQLDNRKPDDARVLTLLAYVRRHLGFVEEARGLYGRALRLDPDSLDAHEYAGEAALLMNDCAAAAAHLQALRRLCAAGCEQLDDLQAAFDARQCP